MSEWTKLINYLAEEISTVVTGVTIVDPPDCVNILTISFWYTSPGHGGLGTGLFRGNGNYFRFV